MEVRPFQPADADFVISLAPRLEIGRPPWRDRAAWLVAVEGWLRASIADHGQGTMVFVAVDDAGRQLGVATVSRATHWTGEAQAWIGELAVAAAAEGLGVGGALLAACEDWARAQGLPLISLTTGAANTVALGFYHKHGYQDEDVKLVRRLDTDA